MYAIRLKRAPVAVGKRRFSWLRWKPVASEVPCSVEVDAGTLRITDLAPISLRRVNGVAYHANGIGAGLELSLETNEAADLPRLLIPARAFDDRGEAPEAAAHIRSLIAARGPQDAADMAEIARLCTERSERIPWLSLWFALASMTLTVAGKFGANADPVLNSIAQGAVVPDMIRAGEFHRLLTAALVHVDWVYAAPMVLGWLFMIAFEKRVGTALVAGGFVGGSIVGYASMLAGGGGFQAYGGSTAFVGLVGATALTMIIDPERLDPLAVRPQCAKPIRAAGIVLLAAAAAATGLAAAAVTPLYAAALFGGATAGLMLCAASRSGGYLDKIARNALIAVSIGAIGWSLVSAARGPEVEIERYLATVAAAAVVDVDHLVDTIDRIAAWHDASPQLRAAARRARITTLARIENDDARTLLRRAGRRRTPASR